ncbi:MAG: NusA antitermination factor [Parcubacteria group bacterium GW2011_GWB1_38_8]|uniref:Transcription termination/antitermination protein NusA n=1 Tax=Candidatus Zambryskibacteria bacterium RIFCSPLOWO2_02_FULL_39_14 TaxID=1802769 RepID=A0A1G2UHU0_9BACT|nr:MAG: NusA antitermination factor [Parcubacteria group bacterium GW2011_GWB1_38_8]KKR30954.1 MAG: NusA antitermination factor [Parcubacteria group bacterium GW2011_GWC1_39_8]OHA95455.1 MAG: transcription termination factor NusA [Candidatus Zambryskibacteria bacterium RIFCSPHIGHO2_02_FULL_39_16]OHB08983.1 MAG: transcription termination factor NusA [Candidatus Zambryskibacteria bacterium RIFCSPLOWO2_02_FULL_39_14]
MFDLKVINSVLGELEEVRGIPRASIIEAIEAALATAYKKEYGKKGQIIRTTFDINTGETNFFQVKIVVDDTRVIFNDSEDENKEIKEGDLSGEISIKSDERVVYNPEHHILIEDARKIKKDAQLDEEIIFPIESKGDYGRIAAQTAKQVIMQKIREAEKVSVVAEFGKREGDIVTGTVQRVERGNIFVDMGRATGLLSYEEQIPGERFSQGERVRAYLYRVEESPRGVFLRLSRSHPKFLEKLFEAEAPELANGTVVIKAVAREAGYRSKIAAEAKGSHIDPVGALVGQRGVRVSTVMSELRGEKIDIIEWSAEPKKFIEEALSPARILNIEINEDDKSAVVSVSEDQQSLAIGKGGQNVRLAAKLTGWRIDIQSAKGEELAVAKFPLPEVSKEN